MDRTLVGPEEAGFTIAGKLAAELLARGTALDLEELTEGTRTWTLFAGRSVELRRREGGFDLVCAAEDETHLEDWFAGALTSFAGPSRP